MDPLEEDVQRFLQSLSFSEVVFEPGGPHTFPDFSVGSSIAVEATRLVKVIDPATNTALQSVVPSTIQTLSNAIKRVKRADTNQCYFVYLNIDFRIDPKLASPEIKKTLSTTGLEAIHSKKKIEVIKGLSLRLEKASDLHATPFILGSISSPQLSGWVVTELLEQCAWAINRKEPKLQAVRNEYKEFWIAVGGDLATGVSESSFQDFKGQFTIETMFDRLVLIDRNTPERSRTIKLWPTSSQYQ